MKRTSAPACWLAFCAIAGCGGLDRLRFDYAIGIVAYGPVELLQNPAEVKVQWPGGSRTLSLSGDRDSGTVSIEWAVPRVTDPDRRDHPADFIVNVDIRKPGFEPWRARYCAGDFVRTKEGAWSRTDQITLHQQPAGLTGEQLEQLSLALPCGIEVYQTRGFQDLDGDGAPEAVLYRLLQSTASQSPLAEIRVLALRKGGWEPLFTANHLGVSVAGRPLPDSPRAPNGYGYRMLAGHTFEKLGPLDDEGHPIAAMSRTYAWNKEKGAFEASQP